MPREFCLCGRLFDYQFNTSITGVVVPSDLMMLVKILEAGAYLHVPPLIAGVVVLAGLMTLVCKARHSHCGCLVGLSYHRRRRPSGLDDACVQGAAFTLWVSRRTLLSQASSS